MPDVCLLHTSGLSREPKGLGRLKWAEVGHVTRDLETMHFQGQKVNLQGAVAYCGGLTHSLLVII